MQVQTTVETAGAELMDVRFVSGEAYEVAVRGHRVTVDQPADAGGDRCNGVVCALPDRDNSLGSKLANILRFLFGLVPWLNANGCEIQLLVDQSLLSMRVSGEQVDREPVAQSANLFCNAGDELPVDGKCSIDVCYQVL